MYEKLRAIFSRMKHCRLPLPADDADATYYRLALLISSAPADSDSEGAPKKRAAPPRLRWELIACKPSPESHCHLPADGARRGHHFCSLPEAWRVR
jgi:hypothetical protein